MHIKKFKLEANLQQIALIRVAANIWLSHPMIAEICDLFSKNTISYSFETNCDYTFKMKMKKWLTNNMFEQVDLIREWLNDIFEQVNSSMKLPSAIKKDLLYIMKPVGENLLDYLGRTSTKWMNGYFYKEPLFPGLDVYCKHIEFDCIGRVDEVKTFLNIYNANGNFSLIFFFYEACTYCLEDVIHSIWNKCSEKMKFEIQLTLSNAKKKLFLVKYWIQFVDKSQSKLPFEFTVIDALKYCVRKANTVGVKYFINKLSQDDKNQIIVPLAETLFYYRFGRYKIIENPRQNPNQYTCNLFYLFAHMTEDDKNKFFVERRKKIIFLLAKEWPWKYLLLDLDYFDKNSYRCLIQTIVETILDDYSFYKKIVYTDLWMIPEIWKKNPNHLKESIAEICWSWDKPMMFRLEAVILVTSVIDDTDGVNKLRQEICQSFEEYCNESIDEKKYEIVDLYLKNILQNDEERKPYQELLQSGSHKKVSFGSTTWIYYI